MINLILFPFKLVWGLVTLVFNLTGRIICAVLGGCLLLAGGVLCATVVGLFGGIPLVLLGLSFLAKAVFIF